MGLQASGIGLRASGFGLRASGFGIRDSKFLEHTRTTRTIEQATCPLKQKIMRPNSFQGVQLSPLQQSPSPQGQQQSQQNSKNLMQSGTFLNLRSCAPTLKKYREDIDFEGIQ